MINDLKCLYNKYVSTFRVFLPLMKLDDQGRMVIIIRAAIHNPNKHKFSDVIKVLTQVNSTIIFYTFNFNLSCVKSFEILVTFS